MKAAIVNGHIKVTAETEKEAHELTALYPVGLDHCTCCGFMANKTILDTTVLYKQQIKLGD